MEVNILLKENETCLLKEGDRVDFSTPFIERNTTKKIRIAISGKLGIEPNHIFRYLKKLVGEQIKKGDLLALKKGLLSTKTVVSELDGTIKEIDHVNGQILINSFTENKNIFNCYFKGKIKKIEKSLVEIDIGKAEKFELKNVSGNFGGETFYFNKQENISSNDVSKKIIVAESVTSFFQTKLEALGASGFISLIKLEDESGIFHGQIKNIEDMKKINKLKLPFCLIDNKEDEIYFYQ